MDITCGAGVVGFGKGWMTKGFRRCLRGRLWPGGGDQDENGNLGEWVLLFSQDQQNISYKSWWWWWWWWWLEKIRKTKIQTQRQIQRQIHTHKYRKIPNTQSQKDRGRFDTRGSPVALLFPKIWPEIQKNEEIQKSRNPKTQKI